MIRKSPRELFLRTNKAAVNAAALQCLVTRDAFALPYASILMHVCNEAALASDAERWGANDQVPDIRRWCVA